MKTKIGLLINVWFLSMILHLEKKKLSKSMMPHHRVIASLLELENGRDVKNGMLKDRRMMKKERKRKT